jgi:hypothetical protein
MGEMLKLNKTLTLLDLSDNEIGMWSEGAKERRSTPPLKALLLSQTV